MYTVKCSGCLHVQVEKLLVGKRIITQALFIKNNKQITNYQKCGELDPYLDPHCTLFSKIKSADICKDSDWVRGKEH